MKQIAARSPKAPKICYLCGKRITGRISRDHVPPRHLFSKAIRQKHKPNLLTLPTHGTCNRSFQEDEEYFIHSFAPVVMDTYAGRSLLREISIQYQSDHNIPLSQVVLKEFNERPSGLYLPDGKVAKRLDPDRAWRVIWKIIRGLFFDEYGRFLPEDTHCNFHIVSPGYKPPDIFYLLPDDPIRGRYPGVFDYKYRQFPELDNGHLWALLFWDKLIFIAVFRDPEGGDNGPFA